MSYARNRYSRIARMEQIAWVLHRTCVRGGLTTHQIAFWVRMRPSGHLRRILREMEIDGWVKVTKKFHRPGIEKSLYEVTANGRANIGVAKQLELPF